MELSGKQKRMLRGMGHGIKPMVNIGKQGLTDGLLHQLGECLTDHELVKLKVLEGCPGDRREIGAAVRDATSSSLVQILGRTILLYRPHPEEPRIVLPRADTA